MNHTQKIAACIALGGWLITAGTVQAALTWGVALGNRR